MRLSALPLLAALVASAGSAVLGGCNRPEPPPSTVSTAGTAASPTATATGATTTTTAPAKDAPTAAKADAATSLYELSAKRLDGTPEALSAYRGKVVLVVNTASECGYTPQYEGLEALYEKKQKQGLVLLGFPSNDFGGQEPGSAGEIAAFCKKNYGVTFPMFEKVVTKGEGASPVYRFLASKNGAPQWNFHKYLVGKDGAVRGAFPSAVRPDDAKLVAAIDKALAELGEPGALLPLAPGVSGATAVQSRHAAPVPPPEGAVQGV
jgi:glutathione peroxidase